jgi:hypothetical protein
MRAVLTIQSHNPHHGADTPGAGFILSMSVHLFDPEVAQQFGIVEAIIIKNFQFWIEHNFRNDRNHHDGRTWTYNSVRAFLELFPYMTKKQLYGALKRLEDGGVIITGNYNETKYDRTTWYAFADEGRWVSRKGKPHVPKKENPDTQKVTPIPDVPPDKIPGNKPDQESPAPARAAVFVVTADGMCLAPEIPVIPEIPKIPAGQRPSEKPEQARPPSSEPDRDWQRWVDRFELHVKKHNDGLGHHWTKIQFGPQGLKGIRTHLVKISTKLPDNSDDDCGYLAWCYVLDHWADLGDEWLGKQFDLTVVLKKITDILNRLKNAATTNRVTPAGGNGKVSTSQARNEALRDY